MKVYMAGPLFTEAEVAQRLLEARLLEEVMDELGIEHDLFSPINAPINDKSTLPTALDIFEGDERELMASNVIFADLSHEDAGVMMELGMVLLNKNIKIYPYLSDIRIATAGEYEGHYVPFGYNQFVIGGLEKYGHTIYPSFEKALNAFKDKHS